VAVAVIGQHSTESTQGEVTIETPVFRGHRCNILGNFGCIVSHSVVGRGWGEEACWRVRKVLVRVSQ
jgi:hypothetical protein